MKQVQRIAHPAARNSDQLGTPKRGTGGIGAKKGNKVGGASLTRKRGFNTAGKKSCARQGGRSKNSLPLKGFPGKQGREQKVNAYEILLTN